MLKWAAACVLYIVLVGFTNAAGPFGTIKIGNCNGGAFSNDRVFSHRAAAALCKNGIILVVGQNINGSWLLSFAGPGYKFNNGENAAIFDGQEQARVLARPVSPHRDHAAECRAIA